MTTVDSWDQDCQWRVEDLEAASMRFSADHRGQGDAGGDAIVAYARKVVSSEFPGPEFVNGAIPPDRLDAMLRRVHLGRCVADAAPLPRRLRVRFTVPAAGGAPQHIATDYRMPLSDAAKACITAQFTALTFPPLDIGLWAIVVRSFDVKADASQPVGSRARIHWVYLFDANGARHSHRKNTRTR